MKIKVGDKELEFEDKIKGRHFINSLQGVQKDGAEMVLRMAVEACKSALTYDQILDMVITDFMPFFEKMQTLFGFETDFLADK